MDTSRSVGHEYLELQKKYIKDLTANWTIDENNFQIAIVAFSSLAKIEYGFEINSNTSNLLDKLSALTNADGISELHLGINAGLKMLQNRSRRVHYVKVQKFMIVVSDGLLSSPKSLTMATNDDIITKIVALGEDVSHYFLSKITGKSSDVFPPNALRLWHHITSLLIHPVCKSKFQISS